MQDTDYKWFVSNYEALYAKYGISFVVVKNKSVLGVYSSYAEGVLSTLKTDEIGTFIVQKCTGDEGGYTNYISSMNFVDC